jgi:CBS domain-containing protein
VPFGEAMSEPLESVVEGTSQPAPASPEAWPSDLTRVAQEALSGSVPPRVIVRTLLSWFDAQRRGSFIVWLIRKRLDELGVKTEPDFNSVWIDSEVAFVPVATSELAAGEKSQATASLAIPETASMTSEVSVTPQPPLFVGGAIEDPTYRIGKLDAANKPVVSVAPNHSIKQAITLMLMHGYSQLPVMQGDRDVKGILTWESVGTRLSLGKCCNEVRDCMTLPQIISSEKSLFAAIEIIAQFNYVLVQAPDRRITGIVTAADLSRQFQQLTEPFLLLGEIEQHIRSLIVNKFTKQELRDVSDPSDQEREIHKCRRSNHGGVHSVARKPNVLGTPEYPPRPWHLHRTREISQANPQRHHALRPRPPRSKRLATATPVLSVYASIARIRLARPAQAEFKGDKGTQSPVVRFLIWIRSTLNAAMEGVW